MMRVEFKKNGYTEGIQTFFFNLSAQLFFIGKIILQNIIVYVVEKLLILTVHVSLPSLLSELYL